MTTKICIHYWVVDSPNGPFSLAKCKKCDQYDAVRNFFGGHSWTQRELKGTGIANSEQERLSFLREKVAEQLKHTNTVKKTKIIPRKRQVKSISRSPFPSKYDNETKLQVLLSLLNDPRITEASRKYNVPTSTIHGWTVTYADWNKVKSRGNIDIFKQLIKEKKKTEKNVTKLANSYNIPRRTLRNWLGNK